MPDHLRVWSALRQTIFWEQAASPQEPGSSASAGASVSASAHTPAPGRDVAAEDVKAFDGAIDPARAGGLSVPAGDPRDALWLVRNLHMVPWDAK